jgi:hypothetical protein
VALGRLLAGSLLAVCVALGSPSVGIASVQRAPSQVEAVPTAAKAYPNCKALNAKYPHGVARKGAKDHVSGSSKPVTTFAVHDAVYTANRKLDRDRDGVACEKR